MGRTTKTLGLLFLILCCANILWAQHPGDNPNDWPDNIDTSDCTTLPPEKSFDIKMKWQSPDLRPQDMAIHGCSTPLVADLDGDGYPEVLGAWTRTNGTDDYTMPGSYVTPDFIVLDGKTGAFKYRIKTHNFQVHGQPVAIADVDKDGKSEIFIVGMGKKGNQAVYADKYVYCYDGSKANTGADDYKWKSKEPLDHVYIPMVADLNNDGMPELVCGGTILNAITGTCILKGEMAETGMGFGDPHAVNGSWNIAKPGVLGEAYYLFAVADIDGDKQLEICAGNTVYKATITNPMGTSGNTFKTVRQCTATLPYSDVYDGQTFVLDFDNDGDMDICVLGCRKDHFSSGIFSSGQNHICVYVWEGQTTDLLGYFALDPHTFSLSIPFAADINGDGMAEIITNGWVYGWHWHQNDSRHDMMHVFRYKKGYSSTANNTNAKNIEEIFTRDQAREFSESSGFTVFDFNQDGKSEIVFRNNKNLYILDGTNLSKLCTPQTCISGTLAEYPIVADVDCDGHADIIYTDQYAPGETSNVAGRVNVCESSTPAAWGPARKVWNQWPYNVVNINEDMTVPKYQFDITTVFSNGQKPFNAFLKQQTKLNKNGDMFAPAPDATFVEDSVILTPYCDSITIDILFTNQGTEALYNPYGLTIYKDAYKGQILYQKTFSNDLAINDKVRLHLTYTEADLAQYMPLNQFIITLNDIGTGIAEEGGQQKECDTTNNRFICDFPGFVSSDYDTVIHHMCVGDIYAIGESIYTEEGVYVDTLTNRMGCDSIVTSYVYTHEISVDLGPDQRYCSDDYSPVTLDAGEANAYEWQNGSSARTFTVFETGAYTVVVFDEYGCSDTDDVVIDIIPNPEVNITKNTEDFCDEGQLILTANSSVPDVTYRWNTYETTQSITITTPGTYQVFVDNQGCTGSASIQIPLCPCEVWCPNAFTPNDDGINDIFLPQISNTLASYELIIFNRWGQRIYRTEDVNQGWNGCTMPGMMCPVGVYYYVLTYSCMSLPEKPIMKHGSITLVR